MRQSESGLQQRFKLCHGFGHGPATHNGGQQSKPQLTLHCTSLPPCPATGRLGHLSQPPKKMLITCRDLSLSQLSAKTPVTRSSFTTEDQNQVEVSTLILKGNQTSWIAVAGSVATRISFWEEEMASAAARAFRKAKPGLTDSTLLFRPQRTTGV